MMTTLSLTKIQVIDIIWQNKPTKELLIKFFLSAHGYAMVTKVSVS